MRRYSPRSRHRVLPPALGALLLAALADLAPGFEPRPLPGRLLLTLRENNGALDLALPGKTGNPSFERLNARFAVTRLAPLFDAQQAALAGVDLSRYIRIDFPTELDLEAVRVAYAALEIVERAEFDWLAPLHLEPDDFAFQWHHETSSGRDAHVTGGWNHSTGDTSVVLGIADSGVDWMHPDLGGAGPGFTGGNISTNWSEFHGAPGVDDDRNGKVDDVRGWDFVQNLPGAWPGEDAAQADNDPRDFNGHGTHVAGIAGARTDNGLGVAGVGFRCRILPLRIGGSIRDENGVEQGVVLMSHAAEAILYATTRGVAAINCSWGSSGVSALIVAVDLAVARGVVVVVSAGNDAHQIPSYLSSRGDCFDVAATNQGDFKASFSNFGTWVDVAAPGVDIFSTWFDHSSGQHAYRALQGTSMAAPIVTGLVGLVKARYPFLQGAMLRQFIADGADDIDALNPAQAGLLGAGRVNALKSFSDRFLRVPGDYPTIAKALAASGAGDTVAVRGDTLLSGPLVVRSSQRLILGGWNERFTARDPRRRTVVSSLGNGPCLEFTAGVDSTAVVDGFRFTGGRARLLTTPGGYFGGGVLCANASPVLRHCDFDANRAGGGLEFGGGGGGFFALSAARLEDCTLAGNQAQQGAGLYLLDATLRLEDCVIDSNAVFPGAGTRGGGIYLQGGSLEVQGGRITRNGQASEGGGVFARWGSLTLRNTQIAGNAAANGGGLALLDGCKLRMHGSFVHRNAAVQLGGGIYALGAEGSLANATFLDNMGGGGAIFAQHAPQAWSLRNGIFAGHDYFALVFVNNAVDLAYNLFWDNPAGHVQGGGGLGTQALVLDPLFVAAESGNAALALHSPALDSGDPAAAFADPDGSRNDRGAYGGPGVERSAPAAPRLLAARDVGGTTSVSWEPSAAPGIAFYAVYRGADSTFVPGLDTYVGSAEAEHTSFADLEGSAGDWYRLAIVLADGPASGFQEPLRTSAQPLSLPRADDLVPRQGLPARQASAAGTMPARYYLHPVRMDAGMRSIRIRFDLPTLSFLRLEVFDVRGRRLRVLLASPQPAGTGSAGWDGRDGAGRMAPGGVYVLRAQASGWSQTRKLTVLR